jgi:hypothetical protein
VPHFPVDPEVDAIRKLKDIQSGSNGDRIDPWGEKKRSESSSSMAGITGRPFWDPHHAGFGPIPSKEGKVREPPLVRETEGIIGKSPVRKTRVEILLEEGEVRRPREVTITRMTSPR